jgi:hypothetical protein
MPNKWYLAFAQMAAAAPVITTAFQLPGNREGEEERRGEKKEEEKKEEREAEEEEKEEEKDTFPFSLKGTIQKLQILLLLISH